MSSAEEDWFTNLPNNPGPSLEEFLATDPSQLPFLQERPATAEDFIRYQIFADDWDSVEHLQQVSASQGEPSPKDHALVAAYCCPWRLELASTAIFGYRQINFDYTTSVSSTKLWKPK